MLHLATRSSEPFRDTLLSHGDAPLGAVIDALRPAPGPSLQPRDDVWDAVEEEASALYGRDVARDAARELRAGQVVPTSNHFGIDTLADSVQGTMLFALRPWAHGRTQRTAVVFGCGTVSMDNLTYPMGLLLYDGPATSGGSLPRRLPIFSNRFRRWTAASVPPFDAGMVDRARGRLAALRREGKVTAFGEAAAARVLEEDCADADTLSAPTYGGQASRINAALWSRLFRTKAPVPRLVQLELEAVTTRLVLRDLRDPDSLMSRLFFTPQVREAVLGGLDGARACWRMDGLRRRLHDPPADLQARDGTVFFWGLTSQGRRVPVTPEQEGGRLRLLGRDERSGSWAVEFTPDGLSAALATGRLIPSLFTSFTALALARGVMCVGGHYQCSYLPVMQQAVSDAVRVGDERAAGLIAGVPTRLCLAGTQFAMRLLDDGRGVPVGPLEIAECGGLTEADLEMLWSVPLPEAHLAAFPEYFEHVGPAQELPADWGRRLTAENADRCAHLIRLPGQHPAP